MANMGQLAQGVVGQAKANALSKQSATPPSTILPLMRDQAGKKQLGNLLASCFDIFPLYGREPEAAANVVRAFHITLADFGIAQIEQAFRFHLQNYKEFPLPADIANIIRRGNKPPFERSVYVSMTRKHPEDRTSAEWAYIRDFEKFNLTGGY